MYIDTAEGVEKAADWTDEETCDAARLRIVGEAASKLRTNVTFFFFLNLLF